MELFIVTDTYYGLIYHLISYTIDVWGGESQNSRNVFKMQNKAIGIFFGLRTKQSYKPYQQNLQIKVFPSVFTFKTINFKTVKTIYIYKYTGTTIKYRQKPTSIEQVF